MQDHLPVQFHMIHSRVCTLRLSTVELLTLLLESLDQDSGLTKIPGFTTTHLEQSPYHRLLRLLPVFHLPLYLEDQRLYLRLRIHIKHSPLLQFLQLLLLLEPLGVLNKLLTRVIFRPITLVRSVDRARRCPMPCKANRPIQQVDWTREVSIHYRNTGFINELNYGNNTFWSC